MNILKIELPIGSIGIWPTNNVPSGWLLLNGATITRSEYPLYFSALNITNDSYTLPDMNLKVWMGYNANDNDFNTLGGSGSQGSTTHTLQLTEIPSHTHALSSCSSGGSHSHSYSGGAGNALAGGSYTRINSYTNSKYGTSTCGGVASTAASHSHAVVMKTAGGGQAHDNMQPSKKLYYITRVQ